MQRAEKILRLVVFEAACSPSWHETLERNYRLRARSTAEMQRSRGAPLFFLRLLLSVLPHAVQKRPKQVFFGALRVSAAEVGLSSSRPVRAVQSSVLNRLS